MEIANLIATIFVLFYLLFKSYFKKKGENLATKEDIGEITREVENVKSAFIKETQHLQSELNYLTNIKTNMENERRESLIEFHKKITSHIASLSDMNITNMYSKNTDELNNQIIEMQSIPSSMDYLKGILELYIDDPSLFEIITNLYNSIIKSYYFNRIDFINALKKIRERFDLAQKNNDIQNEISIILEDRSKAFKEYLDNLSLGEKNLEPHRTEYLNKIRTLLVEFDNRK